MHVWVPCWDAGAVSNADCAAHAMKELGAEADSYRDAAGGPVTTPLFAGPYLLARSDSTAKHSRVRTPSMVCTIPSFGARGSWAIFRRATEDYEVSR